MKTVVLISPNQKENGVHNFNVLKLLDYADSDVLFLLCYLASILYNMKFYLLLTI